MRGSVMPSRLLLLKEAKRLRWRDTRQQAPLVVALQRRLGGPAGPTGQPQACALLDIAWQLHSRLPWRAEVLAAAGQAAISAAGVAVPGAVGQ
jgi:hypothetical protein